MTLLGADFQVAGIALRPIAVCGRFIGRQNAAGRGEYHSFGPILLLVQLGTAIGAGIIAAGVQRQRHQEYCRKRVE